MRDKGFDALVRAVAERIGEEVLMHEDDDYKTCAARYCATCGSYSSHCLRRNPKHEFTPRPCDCSVIASKEQIADIVADELSQLTDTPEIPPRDVTP